MRELNDGRFRPSRDRRLMDIAKITATGSTCLRRAVGCVLVNAQGHVLATGYNGVATGLPHCNQAVWNEDVVPHNTAVATLKHAKPEYVLHPHACAGAASPSGTDLDLCEAIHAEQNALLQCRDVYAIESCYITDAPCMTCTKLLLNTSCQRIVYAREYSASGLDLWLGAHRWVEKL